MAEDSGPLFNQNFRDDTWRSIFGAEPGITGDVDGTSYALALPPGSDSVLLGSPTQDSVSVVAGYMHKIAQGQTHAVLVPPSTDATTGRTDIVAVRYDPARFEEPGPCNLVRIPGVEGSTAMPSYDGGPPGAEDFPLWAVTRKAGQALNQASIVDLRVRTGPNLLVPASVALPTNAPLATRVERAGVEYVRERVGNEIAWTPRYQPTRGERPTIYVVSRASGYRAGKRNDRLGWWDLASDVAMSKTADADAVFTYSEGKAGPAGVRFVTRVAGWYSLWGSMTISQSGTFSSNLLWGSTVHAPTGGLPGSLLTTDASVVGSTAADVPGDAVRRYSLETSRYLQAGAVISLSAEHESTVIIESWQMWAQRVSD